MAEGKSYSCGIIHCCSKEDAEEEEVLYDCIIILLRKMLCLCLSDPFVILIHTGRVHLAIYFLSMRKVMKGYIGNRNLSFKKIYQNRVNKDVVSLPNYWTCCQRMKKEKAAETCGLNCTLRSYNLICLRRWLRNGVTQNIL